MHADGGKPTSRGLPPAAVWKRGLRELLYAFRSPSAPARPFLKGKPFLYPPFPCDNPKSGAPALKRFCPAGANSVVCAHRQRSASLLTLSTSCRPPSGAFFAIHRRFRDRKGKEATGGNDDEKTARLPACSAADRPALGALRPRRDGRAALAGVRLEGAGYDGAEEAALAAMLAAFAIESHVENADAPDSLRCIRAFMPDSNTLAAFIPAAHNPPRTGQPSRRAWNRTCPRCFAARAFVYIISKRLPGRPHPRA